MTGFYNCHKTAKKFLRSYMVLRDTVSNISYVARQHFRLRSFASLCSNIHVETFAWILNHISRSVTLFLFFLKASILVQDQMTNLNMIFHVVVSVYRLFKIENSPQFPSEFRNGQYVLFFQFRKTCNSCRADRTSIISRELQLEFSIK